MGWRRAGAMAGAICAIAALVFPAGAEPSSPSGFGARKPSILGITSDLSAERVVRLLKVHADMWGAKSKTLHEEVAHVGTTRDKASSYLQRVSLQLVPQSNEERSRFGGNDTIRADFSAPSSGNVAVWVSREMSFTGLTTPPSMAAFIGKVFADYGAPTIVADGRIFYLYRKGGQLVSVGRSYTAESAAAALKAPRPPADAPLVDAALGADVGRCMRAFEGPPVSRDLARALEEATCDAALVVALSGSEDRLRAATFQMNDLERRAAAAAIDARARAAEPR